MNQIHKIVHRCVWQIQHWEFSPELVYAFAGVLIVYMFIVFGRDKVRTQ